jgi:hypothetical protein
MSVPPKKLRNLMIFKCNIIVYLDLTGGRGGWKRLYNEEPRNFSASPYMIKAIKSRKMRWVGHVAR